MEYYPSLALIKAASFLGIVVFVKCMRKALMGFWLELWLLSENCRNAL